MCQSFSDKIKATGEEIYQWMVDIRRQIHQNPEVGMQEFETAKLIQQKLDEIGIPYKSGVGGTGVVGLIQGLKKNNGKESKCVGLRADMDALSIIEKNDVPYASKNPGIMHACGHDAHVALLLGAGKILNQLREQFSGHVKLVFQPAEEGPGGAFPMIQEGVLEEPWVDAMFAFHVSSGNKTGTIGIRSGPSHAAQDELRIAVKGKGGHAAYPHTTVDGVLTACQVVTALHHIVPRKINPVQPAVITIGTINGGYRSNIIADSVQMKGTIRYFDEQVGEDLRKWIETVSKGIAQSSGGEAEVEFIRGYPPLINDEELANRAKDWLVEFLGEEAVFNREEPGMGAEDFAFFARQVPGLFMRLGSGGEDNEFKRPHHESTFDLDERSLITGAISFAYLSIKFLNQVTCD